MTVISRTGFLPIKGVPVKPHGEIEASEISVIVPVKDNQAGVDRLLRLLQTETPTEYYPRQVIVVDNNSKKRLRLESSYPFGVSLFQCKAHGPAAARNFGAKEASGSWLLFLDSDCIPTGSTMRGYVGGGTDAIAYAGNVIVMKSCSISRYYSSQETLIPPKTLCPSGIRPDYLITANCLVLKEAFDLINGFDESFQLAGGEDVDLGFRLLTHGNLAYCWESIVEHDFSDGFSGFVKRFIRYGKGNYQVAAKHKLDLHPKPFIPISKQLSSFGLAGLQYIFMTVGFHSQKSNKSMQPTSTTLRKRG